MPCDLEDINIPSLTWSELCWSNLAQFSRNSALVEGLTGRTYTMGEARELAGRVGSGLLRYKEVVFLLLFFWGGRRFWSFLGLFRTLPCYGGSAMDQSSLGGVLIC